MKEQYKANVACKTYSSLLDSFAVINHHLRCASYKSIRHTRALYIWHTALNELIGRKAFINIGINNNLVCCGGEMCAKRRV
jgi:hypothetical protein